jgi:hypothetical protein
VLRTGDLPGMDSSMTAPLNAPVGGTQFSRAQRLTATDFLRRERVGSATRILDRGQDMGQSLGRWNIKHDWGESSTACCGLDKKVFSVFRTARRKLYMADPFHTIVRTRHSFFPDECTGTRARTGSRGAAW